jgi:hypothetical protein
MCIEELGGIKGHILFVHMLGRLFWDMTRIVKMSRGFIDVRRIVHLMTEIQTIPEMLCIRNAP